MTSRSAPPLAVLLLALTLTGCSGAGDMMSSLTRAGLDTRPIQLTDLRTDLAPFRADARYDYLLGGEEADGDEAVPAVEYAVIGDRNADALFFQSALLAGRLHQLQETMARYNDDHLDPEAESDAEFLLLMAAEGVDTLPGIVGDAQDLMDRVDRLDTDRMSTIQKMRAGQGVALAASNLRTILDNRDQIDDMLGDYESLLDDLETIEAGD